MAQEKDSVELLPVFRELCKQMDGKVRVALIGGGPMKERLEMEGQEDTFILFAGCMRGKDLHSACECVLHCW